MSVESFRGPGGAELFYRYDDFTDPWKDAPTLVLAHGFARNSSMWYAWVPLLARHVRIVRPDLRGLGLSKVPAEGFRHSVDSLIRDAVALLDHLNVQKAVWAGEATGALVGLTLAARVPERLHGAVAHERPLESAGVPPADYAKDLGPGEAIWGEEGMKFMLDKGMAAWGRLSARNQPWMKEMPQGYAEWYADQVARNDARLCAEFYRAMQEADILPLIDAITAPALYIEGDRDPPFDPKHREALKGHPNLRLTTVEGLGIGIGYARAQACAATVKEFLGELGLIGV